MHGMDGPVIGLPGSGLHEIIPDHKTIPRLPPPAGAVGINPGIRRRPDPGQHGHIFGTLVQRNCGLIRQVMAGNKKLCAIGIPEGSHQYAILIPVMRFRHSTWRQVYLQPLLFIPGVEIIDQ